jgi:hypothetical protein
MSDPLLHGLSRRHFLAGTGATVGAVLLAACGGGGDDKDDEKADPPVSTKDDLVLAQYFGGPLFAAGAPLRAPFGIADSEGILPVKSTPAELEVTIVGPDGKTVGDPLTLKRHAKGLQRAYFPLSVTLPDAGIYSVRADLGGSAPAEMALQVDEAADLMVIQPGAALPALETPTVDDPRGVTPICTADPVCPLHDVTAAQALTAGQPLALLVATPAFCQVTICGPVLDVLLDAMAAHPNVKALHSEVYADPAKSLDVYAPTIAPLGLHLEPCLILVGSDGKVAERIDAIYDRDELDAALSRLS